MKDPKRLKWCRQRTCAVEGEGCRGPVDAHHEQGHGLAMKAPDDRTMPLCRQHHMDLHALAGPFRGLTKEKRKQWEADMVATYQALYEADSKGDGF